MCCAGKQHLDTPYRVAELAATMKHLLCSLLLTCAVACSAQAYNPDANADGLIGADDVLSILGAYGMPFLVPLDTCSLYLTSEQVGDFGSPYVIAAEQLCSTLIVTCVDCPDESYIHLQLPDSAPFATEVQIVSKDMLLFVNGSHVSSDFYNGLINCIYLGPDFGWRGSVGE